MEAPPYWSSDMPALVQRRGPMPCVNKWQSTYVRYKGQSEGQVCQNGWEQGTSQNIQDQLGLMHAGGYSRSPMRQGLAPYAINMKILTAPAEFAVPVKQDRRLTPDFKVRVEVRYRGRVSFPLTVRAHILSQQEKDNLPEWTPEGMVEDALQFVKPQGQMGGASKSGADRKPPTELKGTTYITHHFEANMSGTLTTAMQSPSPSNQQAVLSSNLVGGGARSAVAFGQVPQIVPSTVIQTPHFSQGGQMLHAEAAPIQAQRFVQHQNQALLHQAAMLGQPLGGEDGLALDASNPFSLTSNTGTTGSTLSSLGDFSDASNFAQMLQEILGEGDGKGATQSGAGFLHNPYVGDAAGLDFGSGGVTIKPEQGMYHGGEQKIIINDSIMEEEGTLIHDFEFLNLEFVKPTRMSKVYICFACTVLDQDILYCIYHIPTVGICRAEQRVKACEKLGIPRNFSETSPYEMSAGPANSEVSGQSVPASSRKRSQMEGSEHGMDTFSRRPFESLHSIMDEDESGARGESGEALPHSRQALRDWILEEYENTGLKRKLTQLDLETLESQAGFPVGGGDILVSPGQWEEFTSQFRDVLQLLKRIAAVWNLEDPCVISGLNMDRRGTVQALSHEPPGTFICRLSWSNPGSLVLSCKVRQGTRKADADGLVHAIIRIDDLQERKVDTWIQDYPSATHVLDVYTHKRVDKRKVFNSNYMRIKFMDELEGMA